MRSYFLDFDREGLDRLVTADVPTPTPGPTEVLIRVEAAAINYRDFLVLGAPASPKRATSARVVPVSDGCGTIEAVGPRVKGLAPGRRVVGAFYQGWTDGPFDPAHVTALGGEGAPGMLAEYVVLPAEGVVPAPEALTSAEAATLPCAGVTAWNALHFGRKLLPGDTVLIVGTGGVAVLALELARLAGARTIVLSSSAEKLARARELGAWAGINYRETPEWEKEVLALTNGRGAELVVDAVGPATLNRSLKSVAADGQVSLFGVVAGFAGEVNTSEILFRRIRLQGINVGSRRDLEALCRAVDHHALHPVIDREFPFDDARGAYEYARSPGHFGKVVIRL